MRHGTINTHMFLIPDDSWEMKETPGMGRGIFAKKDIDAGTVIGDYIGRIVHPEEEEELDKEGIYLMYYHDYASVYPDIKSAGVHVINHSCAPNTWMYTYHGHTLYFALRHIFPGEELTVSYQVSEQDKLCNPCNHICHCSSPICFQTFHLSPKRYAAWAEFHDKEELKTRREKVKFGEVLPLLSIYPKSIPDNPIYTLFGAPTRHSVKIMDKTIPSRHEIREIIRQTGRTIQFANLNLKVHGVFEDLLVSESTVV